MLDTRILPFSVFTNEDSVDVVVWSLKALNRDTGPDVGEKIESPSKSQIQGDMAFAN